MKPPSGGAAAALFKDGVCILPDAVDVGLLAQCRKTLERDHPHLFVPEFDAGRHYVSRGRFYTTIAIHGPFAAPEILLPEAVEVLLAEALGPDFVFDAWGIINAMPGAAEQHWHRDGGILFPGHPLEVMLPASAVTLAIPLVEMNQETGTTGFALGSHRTVTHVDAPDFEPIVPVGSAIVWDYRVFHKGMTNKSNRARPLIYASLCRPWWSDVGNFDQGRAEKLLISGAEGDRLHEGLRTRLVRARRTD
ncbi:MAG: phytanoyl-CoA dioxygenase family protein [Erythrobacter sp.]|jgi:hypothetical protein|nr:phytanoyl-CoA dioxygenase family protein [Erythrobacter sp.]